MNEICALCDKGIADGVEKYVMTTVFPITEEGTVYFHKKCYDGSYQK